MESRNDQEKTSHQFTCTNCGSSDYEHDNYWKEDTCKKCGWTTVNGAVQHSQGTAEKAASDVFREKNYDQPGVNDQETIDLDTQGEETKSVIFEHPLSLWNIFSGVVCLAGSLGVLYITEGYINNDKILNESPVFFLGGVSVLIFVLYKFTYAGLRDLNLLSMKSIRFEKFGIKFIYKKKNVHIKEVLKIDKKWLSFLILGITADGDRIELKVSKGFFKNGRDRRTFIEMMSKTGSKRGPAPA